MVELGDMMLFGERDLSDLKNFFEGRVQANLVCRIGGFTDKEAELLAERLLGQDYATNILSLVPETGKKMVSVEQVRALNNILSRTSRNSDERRLVVVNSVLGIPAQNAFLKLIEEPPNGVFFLLLASREEDYLPTINSRCQLIKLKGPTKQEARNYILSNSKLKDDEADIVLLQSGGVVYRMLSSLEDDKGRAKSLAILGDAKKFLGEDDYGKLRILKTYVTAKDVAEDFLKSLMVVLEIASSKGYKEAMQLSGMTLRTEACIKQLDTNANVRMSMLGLVV
jgi:DNA polymerase III delta prime subunit